MGHTPLTGRPIKGVRNRNTPEATRSVAEDETGLEEVTWRSPDFGALTWVPAHAHARKCVYSRILDVPKWHTEVIKSY